MALIEVKNAYYEYKTDSPEKTAAVKNVSLAIEPGEFWAIIGHTGSGKSTLTELMAGLLKPTAGSVIIEGIDTKAVKHAVREIKGKVGLVFQYPEHQLFEETVLKDVCFGPKNLGLSDSEAECAAREAMSLLGLGREYENVSPFALSGGQKRRAAIAGVIAMKPDVLILDEPTAGLDPAGRDRLLKTLRELRGTACKSIVLVSHSMEDVAENADKVLVMHAGEAVLRGSVREVFKKGEYLTGIGLDVPQVTRLIERLNARGWELREDIISAAEAADAIYEKIREKTADV